MKLKTWENSVKISIDDSEVVPLIPKTESKEMISVRREGNKTKVRINFSSLEVIQECLRKSQYLLLERWTSASEGPALTYGTAFHKDSKITSTIHMLLMSMQKDHLSSENAPSSFTTLRNFRSNSLEPWT
jgi:hypothetical protein